MKLNVFPVIKITSCLSTENPLCQKIIKKNVIVGDLHCANKISPDLKEEMPTIKAKYLTLIWVGGGEG